MRKFKIIFSSLTLSDHHISLPTKTLKDFKFSVSPCATVSTHYLLVYIADLVHVSFTCLYDLDMHVTCVFECHSR